MSNLEIDYGEMLFPPFQGSGDILLFKTEKVLREIDKRKLFKGFWRGGSLDANEFKDVEKNEFLPAFERLSELIIENDLINPRGFYSYFPVIREENTLIILNPSNPALELKSFDFPEMGNGDLNSFAKYFRPEGDVVAFQAVTIGSRFSEYCTQLFKDEDKYSDGFYLNGIGSLLTEELAELVTSEIRRGLAIEEDQGRRFSFGYPGMCDVKEQRHIFELMSIEERLDITLKESGLMVPEHSTVGLFTAFKGAEYFK